MKIIKTLLFTSMMGIVCSYGYADILYLNSGDQLDGRVVSETDETVSFDFGGGTIDFERSEIESIERKKTRVKMTKFSNPLTDLSMSGSGNGDFMEKTKKFIESLREGAQSKDPRNPSFWILVSLECIAAFFACGFTMKFYFSLLGEHYTYRDMLWFEMKVGLIGLLVAVVIGAGIGILVVTSGGPRMTAQLWGFGLAFLGYAITYYVLAKKVLGAGIFKAFVLALVMNATNLFIAKSLELAGFGFGVTIMGMKI